MHLLSVMLHSVIFSIFYNTTFVFINPVFLQFLAKCTYPM